MSLTRKFLGALGIESEKIDEILTAHTDVVNEIKEERDRYKAEAEKMPKLKDELKTLKDTVEKSKDNPYKAQYEELKAEYDQYKADISAKQTKESKISAYKSLLKSVGVSDKRINSIIKVSGDAIDKLELVDDGSIKDSDALKKTITDEWSDFIVKQGKQGAESPNPPAHGGATTMTKDEIMKIKDAGERQKAIADNHELFGF